MNNKLRWSKAQEYEKNWWLQRKQTIDLSYLRRFANELIDFCYPYMELDDKSSILEIGSGPAGIITHLPGNIRCAIDPLEDFYSTVPEYNNYRDKQVKYANAMGESLPFDNNSFDLVIIDNVLDHCADPLKVVDEINRVLKNGGMIYFKQNIYHSIGKFIRNVLEKFEFDKGHPHNYTFNDIEDLFLTNNYKLLKLSKRGHLKQLITELKMKNVKAFVRVMTFMTRDKVTILLQI